jgi:hypothetical protein
MTRGLVRKMGPKLAGESGSLAGGIVLRQLRFGARDACGLISRGHQGLLCNIAMRPETKPRHRQISN